MPNEFLLVLHDGSPPDDMEDVFGVDDIKEKRRTKGAYYKNIERKMTLKKKRANVSVPLHFAHSMMPTRLHLGFRRVSRQVGSHQDEIL